MATILQPGMQEEEDNQQQGVLSTQTGGGPVTGGMTASQSQGASPRQRKGSGRFTNLQKYIQANQTGGQRIAGTIGQNISQDINAERMQSEENLGRIREGIQQAQNVAQQGSQFLGDLRGIGRNIQAGTGADQFNNRPQDFGIQQFTQDPNFGQFQNIQAGRGINENLLQNKQMDLTNSGQRFLGESQDALQRLGTEGGRFGLLKQTFGGAAQPQYTTGQQRLDQLFLARQGLQPLQEQVRGDVRDAREILRQAAQTGTQVGNLKTQEQQLMSDIAQQSASNEQGYLDMLGSYIPEINRQRQEEFQDLETALASYRPAPSGQLSPGLSLDQLRRLGVTGEMGAFDVLENLKGAADVATRGRDAQTFRDVATQGDVDRFAGLAQIAGSDTSRLSQASDLGEAYTARDGDANLKNRLQAAQDAFDKRAAETVIRREEIGKRGRDAFGGRKSVVGGAAATAEDLMNRGRDAFQLYEGGDTRGGWGRSRAERSRDRAWNDFTQWLQDQKFARTIGGGLGSVKGQDPTQGIVGYGSRETKANSLNSLPYRSTVKLRK